MSEASLVELAKLVIPAIGSIAGAYIAVARKLVQFEERRLVDRRDIDELRTTMYGNGRKGVKERVQKIEDALGIEAH